jgi:L-threonylcarbamoyladenylate synthase
VNAIEALRGGEVVILPTDTVYGIVALPEHAAKLADLKGRDRSQPIALLAADVGALLEAVPGLPERVLRALLPGAYTLVLADPRGEGTVGVRVPDLPPAARAVVAAVGVVAATSANEHGGPDPGSVDDIPARIRGAAAAIVDVGQLPGTPSTVLDFTGAEPRVLREGAASSADALARVRSGA